MNIDPITGLPLDNSLNTPQPSNMFSTLIDNVLGSQQVANALANGAGQVIGSLANNASAQVAAPPVSINQPFVIGSTAVSPVVLLIGAAVVYFATRG